MVKIIKTEIMYISQLIDTSSISTSFLSTVRWNFENVSCVFPSELVMGEHGYMPKERDYITQ